MRLVRRLAHWLRLGARDADLAEELAFHREAIERDLIARGYSPAEAREAARRAMGNETLSREASRGVWLWPSLEAVWQDARTTVRGLRRSPAFAAGVMLTFALGIGANAAMFSLIDRMMLRPPALLRDPASVNRVYLYRTSWALMEAWPGPNFDPGIMPITSEAALLAAAAAGQVVLLDDQFPLHAVVIGRSQP